MGIHCPNIRQVVHHGPPDNMESYVQETKQASGDGFSGMAKAGNGRYKTKHDFQSLATF